MTRSHRYLPFLTVPLLALSLTGCQTSQTLAKGISEKSITGSGTVTHSHVGVDTDTKSPVMETLIVSGDYASIRKGETIIRIEESEEASIFNSSAKSKRKKILISNPKPELLEKLKELQK